MAKHKFFLTSRLLSYFFFILQPISKEIACLEVQGYFKGVLFLGKESESSSNLHQNLYFPDVCASCWIYTL